MKKIQKMKPRIRRLKNINKNKAQNKMFKLNLNNNLIIWDFKKINLKWKKNKKLILAWMIGILMPQIKKLNNNNQNKNWEWTKSHNLKAMMMMIFQFNNLNILSKLLLDYKRNLKMIIITILLEMRMTFKIWVIITNNLYLMAQYLDIIQLKKIEF